MSFFKKNEVTAKFSKKERLKSRKVIQSLFNKEGNSFAQYPLRLVWKPMEARPDSSPVQFGLSVPKRRFKKAVNRNMLKRRIREAYRLQKHLIYDAIPDDEQYAFMVLYVGQEFGSYQEIEKAMQQMIRRFIKKIRKTKNRPTE